MRIVGGIWKGRPIQAPDGRDTRPTTDRVRESLASMVLSSFGLDISGLSMLDAFAGSGALGLELLSRGAGRCCFIDSSAKACACIRANLSSLGAGKQQAVVLKGELAKLIGRGPLPGSPYGLVLLDPPYALSAEEVSACVMELASSGMLAQDARILYERSSDGRPLALEGSELLRTREFGTTFVELYKMGGSYGG